MKISFLLPCLARRPSGGFKVVFEYANRLVKRGHAVSVIQPAMMASFYTKRSIYKTMRASAAYLYKVMFNPSLNWQPLDSRIKMVYVIEPSGNKIPDADIIFATAWQTAEYVAGYPMSKGKKFYLVMDFDPWLAPKEKLAQSWKLPLNKIAISKWMAQKVTEYGGENVVGIPPGIDHDRFRLMKEIENRPRIISMMYSTAEYKDVNTGISALKICREKYHGLKVSLFGPVSGRPRNLPDWMNYSGMLADDELVKSYNESRIFVSSSIAEGFALPPAEAMACGCAIASTNCGGIRDYAVDGVNSLLSEPRDPQALAANISKLLDDDGLRIRIAKKGNSDIRNFTWERSTDLLEKELNEK